MADAIKPTYTRYLFAWHYRPPQGGQLFREFVVLLYRTINAKE